MLGNRDRDSIPLLGTNPVRTGDTATTKSRGETSRVMEKEKGTRLGNKEGSAECEKKSGEGKHTIEKTNTENQI